MISSILTNFTAADAHRVTSAPTVNRRSTDSQRQRHYTLTPRLTRLAALFLMLLTLGVGQMWGTTRTFKSGEKIYFKDASGNITWGSLNCLWKVSTGNIYAYFWNDKEEAWSSNATLVSGSWDAANAIYKITVPGTGKEYTKMLFTRGTAGSWSGRWNQTQDQTPDVGNNLFRISNDGDYDRNRDPTHKWKGTWDRYAETPSLIGDFNDWDPDKGYFTDGRIILDLEGETDYSFKVLVNEAYCGVGSGTITNTTSSWWHLDGANDVGLTTGEAGEYCFHWDSENYYLGVYYPGVTIRLEVSHVIHPLRHMYIMHKYQTMIISVRCN